MSELPTYQWIKEEANRRGVRVDDLIALSRNNDPFFMGKPADHTNGKWFADLWERFNYTRGVHTRRVHYHIVSVQDVLLPSGKPYENTLECWAFLNIASKAARYLGFVDPRAFIDQRNPDVQIFNQFRDEDLKLRVLEPDSWSLPELPPFPEMPDYDLEGYEGEQRYQLEVWCEKSTMDDVLIPLCKQYGANPQMGIGELSITRCINLIDRIRRPVRIFYISDFDPAGQSMPVAVARKVEFYYRSANGSRPPFDVKLHPIVLTQDQVRQYQLPRIPIKESELRAEKFEARFGEGAVELDALEALHPGELARILSREMDRYYDHGLADRVRNAKSALLNDLQSTRNRVLLIHRGEIDRLHREYGAIRTEFESRIKDCRERLSTLIDKVGDDLLSVAPDLTDYPVPEADHADEPDDLLFDSSRDYFEQLSSYKKFQGKGDSNETK